jgi:hypothetical protein
MQVPREKAENRRTPHLRKNTAVGVFSVPSMLRSLELGRSRSERLGFRYVGTVAADYDQCRSMSVWLPAPLCSLDGSGGGGGGGQTQWPDVAN